MLATFTLIGLIVGYGIGKMNFVIENKTRAPAVTQETVAATPNKPAEAQTATTTSINIKVDTDYANLEKTLTKDKHWSLGSKKAKVKIEEFSDFQCPFCHRFFAQTMPDIIKDYVASGKALYTFYNFPLDFHLQAAKAAEAALCAGDQNKYWEMHDLLFKNQEVWAGQEATHLQTFDTLAQGLKLNMDDFRNCSQKGKYTKLVQDDLTLGKKKNVSGTPTLLINGKEVVGAQPYEEFKKVIEAALK